MCREATRREQRRSRRTLSKMECSDILDNVRVYAMFCTDSSDNYFQFSRFVLRIEGFILSLFKGAKYG